MQRTWLRRTPKADYAVPAKFHGLRFHQPQIDTQAAGTVIGRWQHSIYNQGLYNNQGLDYYSFGVNLSYGFTPHFSGEAGYNFDDVTSPIPGDKYTRSRVYLGVSASY